MVTKKELALNTINLYQNSNMTPLSILRKCHCGSKLITKLLRKNTYKTVYKKRILCMTYKNFFTKPTLGQFE